MILLSAILAVSALLAPTRPKPGEPLVWEAELAPDEAESLMEGGDWVDEVANRKRLWDNFLATVNCEESPQSAVGVRFTLEFDGRIWAFDGYGRYWIDSRFVREDEQEAVETLENWFRALVERGPYSGYAWAEEDADTMEFGGFEDGRFNAIDFQLLRICEEFNAIPALFWGGEAPANLKSVHELHPRLLKALLIEEHYGDYPAALDEAAIARAIGELVECGLNEGGNFEGWFNALRDYGATHGWAGDNEYFHAQFAERVMRRFNNPGLFVPVVSRKVTDGQT